MFVLNFWSCRKNGLEKGLGIVSPPHFLCDFSRKMFLMLYSIDWPNFIVWHSSLLEVLGNVCIPIVCFPSCDVINFEINLVLLIKSLFYMNKKSKQKSKYLENKKSFQKLFETWECAFKHPTFKIFQRKIHLILLFFIIWFCL